MAKHELVMSAEHPYWQTVLYEGVGRKEILIEETSIREICGRVAVREIAEYDAEMAKIYANRKDAMRNRRRDRRNHPDNPETRKADKIRREKRMYGLVYIEKYGFCWIGGRDGKKKFPEYEAETVRNMRMKSAEAVERKDWLME